MPLPGCTIIPSSALPWTPTIGITRVTIVTVVRSSARSVAILPCTVKLPFTATDTAGMIEIHDVEGMRAAIPKEDQRLLSAQLAAQDAVSRQNSNVEARTLRLEHSHGYVDKTVNMGAHCVCCKKVCPGIIVSL